VAKAHPKLLRKPHPIHISPVSKETTSLPKKSRKGKYRFLCLIFLFLLLFSYILSMPPLYYYFPLLPEYVTKFYSPAKMLYEKISWLQEYQKAWMPKRPAPPKGVKKTLVPQQEDKKTVASSTGHETKTPTPPEKEVKKPASSGQKAQETPKKNGDKHSTEPPKKETPEVAINHRVKHLVSFIKNGLSEASLEKKLWMGGGVVSSQLFYEIAHANLAETHILWKELEKTEPKHPELSHLHREIKEAVLELATIVREPVVPKLRRSKAGHIIGIVRYLQDKYPLPAKLNYITWGTPTLIRESVWQVESVYEVLEKQNRKPQKTRFYIKNQSVLWEEEIP
jgi:hypothetical protein